MTQFHVIAPRHDQFLIDTPKPVADIRRDGGERPATNDGRGTRDTSRIAYAEQQPKLGHAQGRIMAFLKARPGQDFTRAEIGRAIGMPLSGVCGRVNELVHVKRCLIELPRRECAVSGKQAHPVRAA